MKCSVVFTFCESFLGKPMCRGLQFPSLKGMHRVSLSVSVQCSQ